MSTLKWMCPHCGALLPLRNGKVAVHRPGSSEPTPLLSGYCPGSQQNPRCPWSDARPVWNGKPNPHLAAGRRLSKRQPPGTLAGSTMMSRKCSRRVSNPEARNRAEEPKSSAFACFATGAWVPGEGWPNPSPDAFLSALAGVDPVVGRLRRPELLGR
jgi:hypothetical protein